MKRSSYYGRDGALRRPRRVQRRNQRHWLYRACSARSSRVVTAQRAIPTTFRALSMFALLSLALLLGGCLTRPAMKVQTFAFSSPLAVSTNSASAPGAHVLGIRKLQIAPPFDERSLVYRSGDFSFERDPYAQFLSAPAQQLAAAISEILRADGSFGAVVGSESAAKPDTLVEIDVSQLYGDIRKPDSPCAVLAIQVIFVKAFNGLPGIVILQRSYSRSIPVKSATPAAFMQGWNQALNEILAEVASDFQRREALGR